MDEYRTSNLTACKNLLCHGFIPFLLAVCRKSHFSQTAQKCPDARRPLRFSPAGQAGNSESGVATNKERHLATPTSW
jgi:hypothetical protein